MHKMEFRELWEMVNTLSRKISLLESEFEFYKERMGRLESHKERQIDENRLSYRRAKDMEGMIISIADILEKSSK